MAKVRKRLPDEILLPFDPPAKPKLAVPGFAPYYSTALGDAFLANSLDVLRACPEAAINAVITSPPYALHFKKEYGNAAKHDYIEWFLPFAREIFRALTPDGSFVLNIGGSYNYGVPTRSLYHFKLLIALVERVGFHLAQECFWFDPAKMPMPAEWVTVRRVRVKDAVEYVWWLAKTPWPKANNRAVLRPYSKDMERLNQRGLRRTTRPSGHNIKPGFSEVTPGGSIPPNVLEEELPTDMLKFGNNAANDVYTERCKEAGIKIHPARLPAALPEFFLKLLTEEEDIVLDPFAGPTRQGLSPRCCGAGGSRWRESEPTLKRVDFGFAASISVKRARKKKTSIGRARSQSWLRSAQQREPRASARFGRRLRSRYLS